MIFCLKHIFFNLHFYSRRWSDFFVSLEKRGWSSWEKSGKIPAITAAVTAGLSGCHLIKPCLLYVNELSSCHHCVVKLVYQHPLGASVPAAASWLQEKYRFCRGRREKGWSYWVHSDADAQALFLVGGCSCPSTTVPRWARGANPAWGDAP